MKTVRLLFVCIENANRSQMAEAFARMEGGVRVDAMSAGSHPSGAVNPRAIRAMRKVGYDLSLHRSKSLADVPDIEYDAVVTMGCGDACPTVRARRREEWEIPDPRDAPDADVESIRDLIRTNVIGLLRRLGVSADRP